MCHTKSLLRAVVLVAVAMCSAATMSQEAYPSRTITVIVPTAAGSGTDNDARIIARGLSTSLGVPVVVENKAGSNGALAAQAAARAKPDGYTLMLGNATTSAVNHAFFPGKLGYGPNSFDVIGTMTLSPVQLYVHADAPWRSVMELVADAKRHPNKFNCGSGNSTTQVACEVFRKQAGIDVVQVPYKSIPQALNDVSAGLMSFAFSDSVAAQGLVAGRRLRSIGVAARQRSAASPDVATFSEQGMPGFEVAGWTALFAPAGTPAPILAKLNGEVRKSSQLPDVVQARTRSGSSTLDHSLLEARRFVAEEIARWVNFVELSGVKPEQ